MDAREPVPVDRRGYRELAVVRLVGAGRSNPEIAAELYLGEATVKSHLASAQAKLRARNRVQVGVVAAHAGPVEPPPSS
ncbi:MAG: response regulator transcription factor [Dermatophilaceae bacterium]|nr:helix-turn-helix transcriptional regulator [Intrasporangiaceae bacterium]